MNRRRLSFYFGKFLFEKGFSKPTLILLTFFAFGFLSFNSAFAAKHKVTNVTYGSQTGTATAGTGTSVTYTINLSESSSGFGGTSADDIQLTWSGGTPTGVTWSFTSATEAISSGTTTTPSFTPSGSNSTITFTVTTTGATPAGTYNFTLTVTDHNTFGTPTWTSSGLNLLVGGGSPTISYAGSPYTYYTGSTITSLTPAVTNSPTSYSISPALPAGLSFDTGTGIISGTPTATSGATTYTVTATNASGSGNTTISITVLAATISYTGSPFTYLTGVAISALTPTVTGSPASYSISPALSAGLSFDTSTGILSGTPTAVAGATDYTITANYASGVTASTVINITVNLSPPAISYSPSVNVYTTGVAITALTPTNTGGAAASWSINTALPAGLSFNTSTGVISGTPTVISVATTYTITATNAGGSGNTTVNITVNPPAPVISYSPSNNVYVKTVVIPSLTPINTGGAATSYSISPGLPAGLSFNTSTGVISGTPTATSVATTYTITATNAGGSGSTTVKLEVDLSGPTISYSPASNTFLVGTAISTWSPTVLTGNPTSYSISPGLPAGLSFNTSTGAITGTPTATSATATYTVTASNAGGSSTASITITCNNPPPPNISYTPSSNTFTTGVAISTWTPANSGGPVVTWSVSPSLPAGLSFNTGTGAITGTPTTITATTTYTVTAVNSGGSGSTTITITVNPPAPVISYSPSTNVYVVGTAISTLTPSNTGGAAVTWSVSPSLPAGLSFNTSTGVITGTPTTVTAMATYTVTATNAGGSGTTTITLTVNPKAPVISYTPSAQIYTQGTAISSWSPANTGGAATSWSVSPALPAGLTFNTSTGVITGTPTALATIASYTVTATNVTGSGTCTIKITVNPVGPNISYSPSTVTYTVGSAITALTPTNTGGSSTSWLIGPSLPAGLSFDPVTGIISGTPAATSAATTYSISADNDGGTSIAYVTITCVNPTPPNISYSPSTNTYVVGTAISSLTPTNTGGAATSWSIGTALPAGLSFDTSTGIISGTPTAISATTTYSITGTNAAGSSTTSVIITVNAQAPVISYSPATNNYSVGATIASLTPANIGGVATSWSISSALPAGLSFNTSTGVISGTPTATSPTTIYTVTATNVSGSGTTTVTITVNNNAPNITYSPGTVTYSVGTAITAATPTNTGGASSNWTITAGGSLPAGLSMDPTTGIISGTPTAVFATATFTIKATNATGSSSTNLIITVSPHAPVISYSPSTVALTLNAAMTTMTPINTGGAVTGYNYSSTGTSLTGASLSGPSLMWIDASGNIYVANYNSGKISRWNSSHTYLGTYTTGKTISNAEGIVFDSAGNCYVEDTGAGAVYKFGPTGTYIGTIISGLSHPLGISIDPSDNLYIATYNYSSPYTSSVTKYNTTGTLLQTISNTNMDESDGVAIDGAGNIYVLNRAQDQAGTNKGYVTKYNSAGVYQGIFSSGYQDPLAISCDPSGDVFVADSHNNQVKIYSSSGVLLNTINGFTDVEGFVADGNGNLYVSDYTNNTVKEYASLGGYYINAPLPAGLSFNTSTGQITGTPTATFPSTTYTITAYNITGSGSTTVTLSCVQLNDWIGATSTDWNTASNWLGNAVPTNAQSALIGVNRSFNFYPTVSAADGIVNVGSVQFGNLGGQAPGIVVNTGGTLNISGALTYQSDASSGSGYTGTLSGAGTLTIGSIAVVSNTTLGSSYTTTLASSVTNLTVGGNISLTSSTSGGKLFNSTFNITAGTAALTGIIQTTNAAGTTSTFAVAPATTATLQLSNSAALSGLSATGTNVITFNNTGTTIQYSGAAQTVYTSAAITGLPSGVSYYSIAFSGTGITTASGSNLNVAGNFTNSMANDASNYVNLSSPTVIFNGTTQTLAGGSGNGTTFYNVTFSGNGTKTMSSGVFNIASTGILTMSGTSATTILNANGLLTLNSDASSSASVAAMSTGPSITGNVNVQRYITGGSGYRGYRLGASPVYVGTASGNNVISINYLQNSMYLTGSAGGGFDKTGNPTIYVYREDLVPSNTSFISGNFWGISAINNAPGYSYYMNGGSTAYNLSVGTGFLFFYRGNRASASLATETSINYTSPASATLTATGTLNQGQIQVHDWYNPASAFLGYTGSGAGSNFAIRGFNMVGNPYASSIDWETANSGSTTTGVFLNNVSTTVYEFNPATQNYDTYQKGGVFTNHGRRTIVSGEGFFVLATGSSSPYIIFNESAKWGAQSTGLNLFMGTAKTVTNLANAGVDQHLRLQMELDSINTDDTYIGFSDAFHDKYNYDNEDAPYRPGNGKLGLASFSSDSLRMAINKMQLPKKDPLTIPLSVNARAAGLYKMNMTEIVAIPQVYEVWLMDSFRKDSLDMRQHPTYGFNITSDTASQGNNRFKLVIRESAALMVRLLSFTASGTSSGSSLDWATENEQNYTNFTVERSIDGGNTFTVLGSVPASGLGNYGFLDKSPVNGANQYRLKIEDLNGTVTYSNVVTVMYSTTGTLLTNNISVYPNPTRGSLNLNILASAKPSSTLYNIKIVNATGLVMKTGTSTLQTWQTNVGGLLPGSYVVQVTDNNNNLVGRGTFVKL